jgi:2-polyprenyl-3-methyl-5-hydroxy-6-metoxy-1,4-benzoquinol methylase
VSVDQKVQAHFDADARRFDAIYDDRKGPVSRWIDGVWRGVVRRRLDLTLGLLEPLAGKTVLDVGCGSGRFCVAYAERGAARVVGVDFAPKMIDLANDAARRLGVADRCDFRVGRFPDAVADGPFDACTALGFFDYVADPVPLVARMRELARRAVILSFPKAREWRVPVRRLRFWLNGCPLFLYTEAQVKDILTRAGLTDYDWIVLDRDYLVAARP